MPVLYCIQADGLLGEKWVIAEKSLVVGRGEFADAFVDDSSLSRSHFLVVKEGADHFIVDLDSQNGTWVNGKKISGCRLHSGEVIKAGQSLFYFSQEPLSPEDFLRTAAVVCAEGSPVEVRVTVS